MTASAEYALSAEETAPLAASKRVFDIAVGVLLSLLALPLVAVLATVSLVRFRAFPFFVQERIGLGGATIKCVKIRSLSPRVPAYLDKAALQQHGGEERWARVMRKLHLDELPQFWQVVAGTMSLVGPRPMIASIVARMPPEVAQIRHSVRPGITGPWQVSVDGSNLIDDACSYDIAYVRHATPMVDLRILLNTATQALGAPKRPKYQVFGWMAVDPDDPSLVHCPPVGVRGNDARSPFDAVDRGPAESYLLGREAS
jgi:lipopolysaccharide/colanic/teichoic acid biosynthesis glycosyltransferase